jgi:uroporphyrinogen decarboxylase
MVPYEIVKAAIYNKKPERLPVNFGCFGACDVPWLPKQPSATFVPEFEGEDEWGCIWGKTDVRNMGQVKGHPLKSLDDLSGVKTPNYDDDSRYVEMEKALERFVPQGKYLKVDIFMVLFERMHSLHGFENTLTALYTNPGPLGELADIITDKHIEFVENVYRRFGKTIHGFSMSDDWGTQQAAFVSFDIWMGFFFPRYKRIFDSMHDCGYDVWVHSCGRINEIIEGYIRAGVNVVNLQQPRALGITEIGERYKGRICFESLADIQQTLPTGSRSAVDKDVDQLMHYWMSPEGGFVFSDYGDSGAIGVTDPDIKLYMYQRFSEVSEKLYGNPLPEPTLKKQKK